MANMTVKAFLLRHFWSPGYTVVNTLTYGVILAFLAYAIIRALRSIHLRLDRGFFIATFPFILFGATARELVDRGFGVYPGYAPYPGNFFLVAPGIYVSMFFLTSLVLLASYFLFRGRYYVATAFFGVLLFAYNAGLIITNLGELYGFFLAFLYFTLAAATAYAVIRLMPGNVLARRNEFMLNFSVLLAHLLDASATFVGVDYMGFSEKHVLPSYLIEKIGSAAVMFPLKFLVVAAALHVVDDEYAEDEVSRRFIKFVILVLGLGPAIRDLTLIALT